MDINNFPIKSTGDMIDDNAIFACCNKMQAIVEYDYELALKHVEEALRRISEDALVVDGKSMAWYYNDIRLKLLKQEEYILEYLNNVRDSARRIKANHEHLFSIYRDYINNRNK